MPDRTPVRIGQIVGAFGLRGEVKVKPLTEFWERFQKGARLRLKGDWVRVDGYREHKDRPLLKLSGIDTKSAAEAIQWEYLEAIVEERPALEEYEFLVDDLIGMQVVADDGLEVGTVQDVIANPGHDILQIGDLLIPVVKEFIVRIDLETRTITVHLIPGMLPGT